MGERSDCVRAADRLYGAGVEFDTVAVYLPGGEPVPAGVDLLGLDPAMWGVVGVPTFVILPPGHPDAAFVAQQMRRYFGDPHYHALMGCVVAGLLTDEFFRGGFEELL